MGAQGYLVDIRVLKAQDPVTYDLWLCIMVPAALSAFGSLMIMASYFFFSKVRERAQQGRLEALNRLEPVLGFVLFQLRIFAYKVRRQRSWVSHHHGSFDQRIGSSRFKSCTHRLCSRDITVVSIRFESWESFTCMFALIAYGFPFFFLEQLVMILSVMDFMMSVSHVIPPPGTST
jgi:hypothetical protein